MPCLKQNQWERPRGEERPSVPTSGWGAQGKDARILNWPTNFPDAMPGKRTRENQLEIGKIAFDPTQSSLSNSLQVNLSKRIGPIEI